MTPRLRYEYTGDQRLLEGADWLGAFTGLKLHFHEELQVSILYCGRRDYIICGRHVTLRPGQLLLIPSFRPHHALPTASNLTRSVEFYFADSELPSFVAARLHGVQHLILNAPRLLDVRPDDLPDLIIGEIQSLTPSREPDCNTGESWNSFSLVKALSLGETLADVVAHVGLTREGFIRAFARQVGMTPHAYKINQRLNMGRSLLRDGLSLAEAAHEAGFSDQSHFGRFFLSYFGATPGHFRSAHHNAMRFQR